MTGAEIAQALRTFADAVERQREIISLQIELVPGLVVDLRPPASASSRRGAVAGCRVSFAEAFEPLRCATCGLDIARLEFAMLAWLEPKPGGVVRVAKVTHKGACDPGFNRWVELSSFGHHELDRISRDYVTSPDLIAFLKDDVFYQRLCAYCGILTDPGDRLSRRAPQVDHVIPRIQGGSDAPENLVLACRRCNARKGGRTPEQAGMELRPQ